MSSNEERRSELRFDTVDVFTTTPYAGNPLAIVHLPAGASLTQEQKQRIAREFNLSETVILHGNPDNAYDRKADIFVTTSEIPFAGHPTIGSLVHIGSHGPASSQSSPSADEQAITLRIKAGTVRASYSRSTGRARASIPFEIFFSSPVPAEDSPHDVPRAALAHRSGTPLPLAVVSPCRGMSFMLVEMVDGAALSSLHPGVSRPMASVYERHLREEVKPSLLATYYWKCRHATLEGKGDGAAAAAAAAVFQIDARLMVSRSAVEDPATGSAACSLASAIGTWRRSWYRRGGHSGKAMVDQPPSEAHEPTFFESLLDRNSAPGLLDRFEITQGRDMGRESQIVVEVVFDEADKIVDVILEGQAVDVMKGTLKV